MTDLISIYVRPSGDRVLLNIYVPKAMREQFLASLGRGAFGCEDAPMEFRMTVLDKWKASDDDRHVHMPISAINIADNGD